MFRVWHYSMTPLGNKEFHQDVTGTVPNGILANAASILTTLANYDNVLGDDIVLANAQGLEYRENPTENWQEWYSDDSSDIHEWMENNS